MITTILISAAGIGLGAVLWRAAMAPIDRLLEVCELLVSPPEDWAGMQARPGGARSAQSQWLLRKTAARIAHVSVLATPAATAPPFQSH